MVNLPMINILKPLPNRKSHLTKSLNELRLARERLVELAAQAERDEREDLVREYCDEFYDLNTDIIWHRQELRKC